MIQVHTRVGMLLLMLLVSSWSVFASSHREAPLIANDPLADNTDVYAFRSPDDPSTVTIIANYIPAQLAFGGPNYYTFGENVRYEIHIDNDVATAGDDVTYYFMFERENQDPTTFFNIRLGQQNLKTTYSVMRSMDGGETFETILTGGVVPPYNIGPRSIEGGAGLGASSYAELFNAAITTTSTGETVFCGPVDDPFYVDLGGIFDLGNSPRQDGNNRDGLGKLNTHAIALQIPITTLLNDAADPASTDILDPNYVIGVWAAASRRATTTLSTDGDTPAVDGDWVQVSRLGMPLTNEAVIPIGMKDLWNATTPYGNEAAFYESFYNPELALYMDDRLFGGAVPSFAPLRIQTASLGAFDFGFGKDGLFALKGNPALDGTALDDDVFGTLLLPGPGKARSVDLWPAFHTGVPNVIPYQLATGKNGNPLAAGKPFVHNFLPNGGDMLRLNMNTPVTPRDSEEFSALGLIQAAVLGLTDPRFNATTDVQAIPNMDGFPNGRRLEDDVTRIELQAVAGVVLAAVGLWYDDFDPAVDASPVTQDLLDVLTYSTGVEANDAPFQNTFPYLAMPWRGTEIGSTGDDSGNTGGGDGGNEDPTAATFFVSSNTQAVVGVYNVKESGAVDASTFMSAAADADGIHYDEENDVLYQLNRADNVINAYSNVLANLNMGMMPELTATSTSDFSNGREIAVSGNKLVVAQDENDSNDGNKLVVYDITPTSITLSKTHPVGINLWGIHATGSTLYAIVDNSSDLAIFDDFFANEDGMVMPSNTVTVEGIVRTHGLTYIADRDMMLLTDVGSGAVADDGAYSVVRGFMDKAADGTISLDEQIRIEGDATFLGNPVDIAYVEADNRVYIAERANGGGRVLGFVIPEVGSTGGNIAPDYNVEFAGASAITLGNNEDEIAMGGGDGGMDMLTRFFASSNNSGMIGTYTIGEDGEVTASMMGSVATDADGLFYVADADVLYQINRTDNVVNAYSNFLGSINDGMMPQVTATSTSDFTNGREIAVSGNQLVVAQDENDSNGGNKLLLYNASPTDITLVNIYPVDFNLWGIFADGNTLYAIVDNSSDLAVFDNFFEFNGTGASSTPDRVITVEGIFRTHGLTYIAERDMMILTDVGSGANPEDGAFTVVRNYMTAAADGRISLEEQIRIEGDQTFLGNPVDVIYVEENDIVYIAERANGGGRILGFTLPAMDSAGGNIAPVYNVEFAGASAIAND